MTVVLGFIVRIDHCGASSFVRWLAIRPSLYTAMLSFFRARSWKLGPIMRRWWQIVLERCIPVKIDGRLVLAGDGIKVSKEADSSVIPSEEVVQSVVQQEYFQNFHAFSNDAIYTIIMSKSRGYQEDWMPSAA